MSVSNQIVPQCLKSLEPPVHNVERPPATVPLRASASRRRLDTWALVLAARGLHPLIRRSDGRFELHVPPTEACQARAELDASDAEEQQDQRTRHRDAVIDAARPKPTRSRRALLGGFLPSLLLLAFFAVTGPRAEGSEWFSVGTSDAARVLHGEWWRTVTALTLHADGAHVLSNVAVGTVVLAAVMHSVGVGFGAALVLTAGVVGNWLNAVAHQELHRSVGFSTALFGAIGILGGLTYAHRRMRTRSELPPWTALAASFALLALLGMGGERTDVWAHLFGALAGQLLGLIVGFSHLRPRSAAGQFLAGLCAMAAIGGSWLVALS